MDSEIVIAHRRALHKIPEDGECEFKTQRYILDELGKLGFDRVEEYATGVRAVLITPEARRTIAFRADMDALPIEEKTRLPFKSEHAGWMHACGHDGHMAVLLGLAHELFVNKARLKDNVVLIFQPAEEGVGGALPMIKAGALKNPDVDEIYGLHIMPSIPKGKIGLRDGAMLAQSCEFDIDFHGVSAHGASPHLGADAVAAAAHCVGAMQNALAYGIDPANVALLTVGKFEGGTVRNVIADYAHMECITRCFSDEIYGEIKARIMDVLRGVEIMYGVKAEYTEKLYYPPVINNPETNARLRGVLGDKAVEVDRLMIAEDFSYYQREAKGSYMLLGSGGEGYTSPLHSDTFDFDERILADALGIYLRLLNIEG